MNDTCKKNCLTLEQALEAARSCKYALLYRMSELVLAKTEELSQEQLDLGECLEARFFDDEKEVHLFRDGDDWKAVLTEDKEGQEYLDREYYLAKRFRKNGPETRLRVREYTGYDTDGQIYVTKTRLAGIR